MPKSGEEKRARDDWKKPNLREAVRATAYAFQASWKYARAPLVGRVACMVAQAAVPGLQVAVLAAAVRAIERSRGFGGLTLWLFVALAGVMVLNHVLTRFGWLGSNFVTMRLRTPQAEAFYYSLNRVPLESFEDSDFHDQLLWGASGVENVASLTTNAVWGPCQAGLASILVLAQLAPISPFLPFLVVLLTVPARILAARIRREAILAQYGWTASFRKANYWERLLTRRECRAEVLHLGLQEPALRRWKDAKREIWGEQGKTARKAVVRLSGLEIVDKAMLLAMLLWVGWASLSRSVGPAVVIASIYALQQYAGQLAQIDYGVRAWWQGVAPVACMLRRIREAEAPEEDAPSLRALRRMEMKALCFRYPGAAEDALREVDVTLEIGKSYAIVGRNGAGKSTFVKLLCGLYAPTSGEVLADGSVLTVAGRRRLTESSAMAFQESVRLPVSLRKNLTAGAEHTDAEVSRVASACGLEVLIASLTNGLDTELGRATGGSVDISAGQWQRVALARALLKDARVVVFDEPASAQDPLSELNLYRSVVSRDPARITVVVSHRLAVATLADEVLFFEDGRIVARGSHAEVMHSCPAYAADFERQAELYLEAADA
jgi:ABC-type multidrug transport system fused ATPase/permease subunit